MLKKLLACLFCLSGSLAEAQQFDWAINDTAYYTMNPDYPQADVSVGWPGHVVSSELVTMNQFTNGEYRVRAMDSNGNLVYSFTLGPIALVTGIEATPSGKVYIAGSFSDTLNLNNQDTLILNNNSIFLENAFIICIDPTGNLSWKRNLSLQHEDMNFPDIITTDIAGNCWYGHASFDSSFVAGMNAAGQDVTVHTINGGIRTISGLSFDGSGNLYVSGSVENSTVTIGTFSKVITETYNMFLTRFDASGLVNWFMDIHDITFQFPRVKTDPSGNAIFCGVLMDSAVLGAFQLPHPQWNSGMILFKADAAGNVLWANSVPIQPTITGSFSPSVIKNIVTDANGNVIVLGRTTGSIDWGNGVVSGVPGPISGNYTLTILAYNSNGVPQWHLESQSDYINPMSIVLVNSTTGYISSTHRGDVTYGPFAFTFPNNYTFSTSVARFTFTSTGTDELSRNPTIQVYPNPSDGHITFSKPLDKGKIQITDIQGRMVREIMIPDRINSLDLQLPAGHYLLKHSESSTSIPLVISN